MTLQDLGWNDAFAAAFAPFEKSGWLPARLIRDNKITYGALLHDGEQLEVVMSGKVYHDAETDADLPAVGDWVALDVGSENVIRARLPRQTCLSRKLPGKSTEEQVIASSGAAAQSPSCSSINPTFSPPRKTKPPPNPSAPYTRMPTFTSPAQKKAAASKCSSVTSSAASP